MKYMIKVGDYIRIKNGGIRKIDRISEGREKTVFGKYGLDIPYNNCNCVAEKKIEAHSEDIIDLIKIGDFVNGKPIEQILEINGTKCVIVNSKECKGSVLDRYLFRNEEILNVVTREEFNFIMYNVEEV